MMLNPTWICTWSKMFLFLLLLSSLFLFFTAIYGGYKHENFFTWVSLILNTVFFLVCLYLASYYFTTQKTREFLTFHFGASCFESEFFFVIRSQHRMHSSCTRIFILFNVSHKCTYQRACLCDTRADYSQ